MIDNNLKFDGLNRLCILEPHGNPCTNNCFWCKAEKAEKIFSTIFEAIGLIEKDFASIADISTIWKVLQKRFLQLLNHYLKMNKRL
jgi:hypothetical protein